MKIKEKSIPIDRTVHDFQFTKRWFKRRNQITWSTFLPKRFPRRKPWRMLQIGVFEGMDLVWCLQNILNHRNSIVWAIDPWDAMPPKWSQEAMDKVKSRFLHNIEPWSWSSKVVPLALRSESAIYPEDFFDLAVIDGWHEAEAVYADACNCIKALKVGGWMIFDDVRPRVVKKSGHVKDGLDRFLREYGDRVKLAWSHEVCDCYERVK